MMVRFALAESTESIQAMATKQPWRRTLRKWCNTIAGAVGFVLGVWSLKRAVEPTSIFGPWTHQQLGYALISFWALVPPLFFWVDWVWLCSYLPADDPEREVAKHTHDLNRNIWIALVAILTVLFAVKMPLGE
jgi:hypothetical protein